MTSYFTYAESSLLVKLLIAHCLSDFLLQPTSWVTDKRNKTWSSRYLYLHVLVTAMMTWLLLFDRSHWLAVLIISATHLLIDGSKLKLQNTFRNSKNADFRLFIADQVLHVVVIIVVWLSVINGWSKWTGIIKNGSDNYRNLLRALGYIIVTTPVGYVIQFLTRKWTADLATEDSLPNAGKWIGILERILILTMVFINQFSAIGFLVAAKSILRVTDKPDQPVTDETLALRPFSSRKHTEYVLIGTFLSVAVALFTGLFINILLRIKN